MGELFCTDQVEFFQCNNQKVTTVISDEDGHNVFHFTFDVANKTLLAGF